MHKFEKANFNIDHYDETENYGKFVIEPLERGFGITLGNALRRVLLLQKVVTYIWNYLLKKIVDMYLLIKIK